jgi:hypothetical protein
MIASLLLALSAVEGLPVQAADWPSFRGPNGDGVAPPSADPPIEWSESRNVAWKTALPGRGRSSPVVLGGRVYLTTAVERGVERKRIGPDDMQTAEQVSLGAVCVDAESGRILWSTTLRELEKPDPVHWMNSWATPTPAAAPGRLYCEFAGWGTWCLDAETGKPVWERRIPFDHQVGPGSSIALHGKLLLMIRDGRDAQFVAALDAATGETVWRTERPPIEARSPNLKKSFSSPVVARQGGREILLAVGPHWTEALDPATGSGLWRLRHGEGYSIGSAPVAGGGLVYFSTGFQRANLVAVRADGSGDVTGSHVAWRAQKGVPAMSSPLLAGEGIYWVSDDGIVTAADPKTGDVRWQERLGEAHVASPIAAAGRLYFFGREGK